MTKEVFTIFLVLIILVISFSGCISDDNHDYEKPSQGDVELRIELDKSELIINESSINVSIILINKVDKYLSFRSGTTGINLTQLDILYNFSRKISVPGSTTTLNPYEKKGWHFLTMDTDFFSYKKRGEDIIGNYSVRAFKRGGINIESNIEYFNIRK